MENLTDLQKVMLQTITEKSIEFKEQVMPIIDNLCNELPYKEASEVSFLIGNIENYFKHLNEINK